MQRIIKKYANRRLYDTKTSRYITLEELKDLIIAGQAIKVLDAKSDKDLTREVLMQLVADQEALGAPILNETILTSLIQFYGHPMQKLASQYLQMALEQLITQRSQLGEQLQNMMQSPADMMSGMVQQNLDWMNRMQASFLGTLNPAQDRKEDTTDE
jgi:polyhydroxyalkanoate synthesis repressor PhaR